MCVVFFFLFSFFFNFPAIQKSHPVTMPSTAHTSLTSQAERTAPSLHSALRQKKIQCTPIVKKKKKKKKNNNNNTTQTKKLTTKETTASSAASWVYSGQ